LPFTRVGAAPAGLSPVGSGSPAIVLSMLLRRCRARCTGLWPGRPTARVISSLDIPLKTLILVPTHRLSTSGRLPCARLTREHRQRILSTPYITEFEIGNPGWRAFRAAVESARPLQLILRTLRPEKAGRAAQFSFDAEELIVFGDAVGARSGARLDLARGHGYSEVGDEGVFRFAGAV
jgi:hypothetical protein